jgi:hypothetical protein
VTPASYLHRVPLTEQLRKCKVKGCKRMARITDYWYCREHRVWLRSGVVDTPDFWRPTGECPDC